MSVTRKGERGFTLPELLVSVVLFGIVAIFALYLVRPQDYAPLQRNGERWAGVAQLTHALKRYAQDNGGLPKGITAKEGLIGNDEGMLDLCDELTPTYLDELPVEPLAVAEGTACGSTDVPLITGYAVRTAGDGKFQVYAPLAEKDEQILLTQSY